MTSQESAAVLEALRGDATRYTPQTDEGAE